MVLGTVTAALAQSDSFMSPMGPIAAEQKAHFLQIIVITMIAIIPVFVLLPLILLKYRRSKKSPDYQPKWEFSLPLEIIMWAVPVILTAVLSVYLWKTTHRLDPYIAIKSDNPTLNVQVVGLDWKWLFIYPDLGIASVGELAFPADHPVSMTLTTDTVMQSFIISALAGQIYAMPGMTTKLNVIASEPGTMQGENMQYNGIGFTGQKFAAIAMEPADFEVWVKRVRRDGIALDDNSYSILAKQSTRTEAHAALATSDMPKTAIYFTLADTKLFGDIVNKYHGGHRMPEIQITGDMTSKRQEVSQ
ncbi:MAG: cytochrome ubiquinol oxidase subunit II [Rhodobacteraceae bacterium]|nr:cytochrome ubiquinol oxidase subunit II [Paracoccaceae bacterium]